MSDLDDVARSALAAECDVAGDLAAGDAGGVRGAHADREDGDDSGNGETLDNAHFYLPGKENLQISKNECRESDRSVDAFTGKDSLILGKIAGQGLCSGAQ
jgi:hypothetical protein